GYYIGVSEDKAGPPSPYHDALNGSPNVLLHNDGHGRFVDVTDAVGLEENNDRFSFAPAWGDYDEDGWPDLLVANDFGRKNLYHNEGLVNGQIRFKDVAASAGVEGRDDLYVANGRFTRDGEEPSLDVDSFFWRQVVAQSPLTRNPGTAYDDGWRATNRLLVSTGAQAQHERNVLCATTVRATST